MFRLLHVLVAAIGLSLVSINVLGSNDKPVSALSGMHLNSMLRASAIVSQDELTDSDGSATRRTIVSTDSRSRNLMVVDKFSEILDF